MGTRKKSNVDIIGMDLFIKKYSSNFGGKKELRDQLMHDQSIYFQLKKQSLDKKENFQMEFDQLSKIKKCEEKSKKLKTFNKNAYDKWGKHWIRCKRKQLDGSSSFDVTKASNTWKKNECQ